MDIISTVANSQIKEYKKLKQKKYRNQAQMFMIENEHLIQEALTSNCLLKIITTDLDYKNDVIEIIYVRENVMKVLSNFKKPSRYLGICTYLKAEISYKENLVVLDNIQDPGNLGTILRNSLAFDCQNIIIGEDCVDLYNYKTIQASQGALFKLNIIRINLKEIVLKLREKKYCLIGTSLKNAQRLEHSSSIFEKKALFFGNEGQGIKKELLNFMDYNYYIEIKNIDSLNVGCASAIIFYQFLVKR